MSKFCSIIKELTHCECSRLYDIDGLEITTDKQWREISQKSWNIPLMADLKPASGEEYTCSTGRIKYIIKQPKKIIWKRFEENFFHTFHINIYDSTMDDEDIVNEQMIIQNGDNGAVCFYLQKKKKNLNDQFLELDSKCLSNTLTHICNFKYLDYSFCFCF